MPTQFLESNALPLPGNTPNSLSQLPRGLIVPPDEVRQLLERERPKHSPEAFASAEERLLNEWTVAHYYDSLNLEVIYRATHNGPEILAVGLEEVFALKKTLPLEEQLQFKTFLGY